MSSARIADETTRRINQMKRRIDDQTSAKADRKISQEETDVMRDLLGIKQHSKVGRETDTERKLKSLIRSEVMVSHLFAHEKIIQDEADQYS